MGRRQFDSALGHHVEIAREYPILRGFGVKYNTNDGSDWNLGVTSRIGQLPHDGSMGLDGTLYYKNLKPPKVPSHHRAITPRQNRASEDSEHCSSPNCAPPARHGGSVLEALSAPRM
jgi:hypothetical protein